MKWFVARIFRDHFYSLEPRWSWIIHTAPAIACFPFVIWNYNLSQSQLGAILAAVSIYSALMFGILVPASDQCRRLKRYQGGPTPLDSTVDKIRLTKLANHYDVAKGVLANISFSIIISIVDVLFLIIALCLTPDNINNEFVPTFILKLFLIVSAYFFVLLLVLLLVIVRTIYGSWLEENETNE